MRNKYKDQKSTEQQFAEAKLVPEKDKEHWAVAISGNLAIAIGIRVNNGTTYVFIKNPETGDMYLAETVDGGIGVGTPNLGIGISGAYFKDVNKPEDLNGWVGTAGGTFKIAGIGMGGDIHLDLGKLVKGKNPFAGIRLSPTKLSKGMNMSEMFDNPKLLEGEFHVSADISGATWSIKLNNTAEGKYIEEQLKKINPNPKKEPNLEEIKFMLNYLEEHNEEINNMKAFKKATDRLQKLRAEGYYD